MNGPRKYVSFTIQEDFFVPPSATIFRAAARLFQPIRQNDIKEMKIQLDPLLGLRDFYPEDMRVRNWLFALWKEVANEFGFSEYDASMVEREELYTRKAGEEIVAQMYNFEDKKVKKDVTSNFERAIKLRNESKVFSEKVYKG